MKSRFALTKDNYLPTYLPTYWLSRFPRIDVSPCSLTGPLKIAILSDFWWYHQALFVISCFRKGRCVMLFLASRWNYNCYSLHTIYRSLLLSLEHLIVDPVNQMRGFVVIADWTEFSFKNSLCFNPRWVYGSFRDTSFCGISVKTPKHRYRFKRKRLFVGTGHTSNWRLIIWVHPHTMCR